MAARNIADFIHFPAAHRGHRASLPPDESLVLITQTLATPAEFMLHHFIHTALLNARSVVFISFMNNYHHHASSLRKWGLDLTTHKQNGTFTFIDGFSDILLPPPSNTTPKPGADPRLYFPDPRTGGGGGGISSFAPPITTALKGMNDDPVLIIEGLETVSALGLGDANEVLDLVTFLQKFCSTTLLSLPIDPPLLRPLLPPTTTTPPPPLERAHALLLTSLAARAFRIINVEPLSTGRAKDVTGVLRMVRGGASYIGEEGEGKGEEEGRGEWLFMWVLGGMGSGSYTAGLRCRMSSAWHGIGVPVLIRNRGRCGGYSSLRRSARRTCTHEPKAAGTENGKC
ncbi:hypothetical protein G7K_0424-t1 [Saitoella complicata NRRL Y-17804]|uniref:Elongator complex protein 6 n=1 Tax=Saitoella complicata (strain BCRC 22490 / CBS 7301 / JCM 7358 / NBRC 10748 / NRRL Y-17804) TaxID=698492 RepID=A0A0E9N8F7_SAICN|nr:hypothetical protein G7K_0424-t1 [Saitoella complicata NRRL Y-17804]